MNEIELGLSTDAVKQKQSEYGYNTLPEKKPPSGLTIFLSQLKSPLVYILLGAALVTFLLGEFTDAVVISVAVFLNTILGFFQERRAENALASLKKMIHPTAEVIRDGKRQVIDVKELVPGDVCIVNSGDKMPADGKIIRSNRFFVSEAMLTGESVPVSKNLGDKVYMGTIVTAGDARLLVEVTGEFTEIGKIALSVQEPMEETPLRKQLIKFSRQLTYLVIFLTIFVFVVGIILGIGFIEIFKISVALAVSSIPEGLLVGLTVVLAVGMQKILKRKGLVRNLVSAETLGGVTTICVDKTGTLTEGVMRVTDVVGAETDIAKQGIIANDLDDPIVIALWEWAQKKLTSADLKGEKVDSYLQKHPRIDSIPFSSKDRYFASLNKVAPSQKVLFVSGAPEFILEWSTLSEKEKSEVKKVLNKLTLQGKRVVGFAKKKVPFTKNKITDKDSRHGLEWVGLVGFTDPLRVGVKEALQKTLEAKVKLVVITGDYSQTAVSIMKDLGLNIADNDIVLGSELVNMHMKHLQSFLENGGVKLFARTTPNQKLKIVNALKDNGEVVAMMGDGVNDAPALKKADIGIVVGEATDVAKESADLVLLDSSFATITAAIEEGRGIFDNIRKIILYLMSDAFSEILIVVGAIVLSATFVQGLPIPLTAVQILWINLISDGFPHLALTVDPRRADIMSSGPRKTNEPLIPNWMKKLVLAISATSGIMGLIYFAYFYLTTNNIELSQSIAFAVLGTNTLVYVYSVRALEKPFWSFKIFENSWLNIAVIGGFMLQLLPFATDWGRSFLGLVQLSLLQWMIVVTGSVFMFMFVEFFKKIVSLKGNHTLVS